MSVIEIGLISAGITFFINYCIGKPGGEFSPYEIFSSYTVWFSKRRLKKAGLYADLFMQYKDSLQRVKSKAERITLHNDIKKIYYETAAPFFTWERAFGMCSVCNNFWVSIIFGFAITQNVLSLLYIVVISHIAIRLLNKLL